MPTSSWINDVVSQILELFVAQIRWLTVTNQPQTLSPNPALNPEPQALTLNPQNPESAYQSRFISPHPTSQPMHPQTQTETSQSLGQQCRGLHIIRMGLGVCDTIVTIRNPQNGIGNYLVRLQQ